MPPAREWNFDGLVGPTHHFGGLSFGNVASADNEGLASNPREAALQGLGKMRLLHELGVPQAVLPPHLRPELGLARRLGFSGAESEVLAALAREAPLLLAACTSASSMWTANAATVSPSADSADGRVHFTPANLQRMLHRSIEWPTTQRILRAVFPPGARFAHHEPLPSTQALGDEGAANHTRLAVAFGQPGVQLFAYGEVAAEPWGPRPRRFPARQTLESCQALARLHGLTPEAVVFAQQHPDAIDGGVFHNDVISVGHQGTFLVHELAFREQAAVLARLRAAFARVTGGALRVVEVPATEVSLADAVGSYLFNSQLVSLPAGGLGLVAPVESRENAAAHAWVEARLADGTFAAVHHVDLRQSMRGGGGPACLRLRVVLTPDEEVAMASGVRFSPALHARLTTWVERHYRERLTPGDLADPALLAEARAALDELTALLGLGALYPFQLGA